MRHGAHEYLGHAPVAQLDRASDYESGGSGVRISSGAPALSTHLPCKKYCHFTEFARNRARANFAPNALVHRAVVGAIGAVEAGLRGRTEKSDDGRIFEIIDEAIQRFGQVT
jgi:hypothetical protein